MSCKIHRQTTVTPQIRGRRLDQLAVELFADFSRARIQEWIRAGDLTVNGERRKPKHKLYGGEHLSVVAYIEDEQRWQPQDIPVDVVHADEHLIVVNKPDGLVVHPGAGVPDGTLLNALLYHFPELAALPRAGIVHRLDKQTTGLMVIARSLPAHTHLVAQLQSRTLGREYEAIVFGELTGGGSIDRPIGRHPTQRTKMAIVSEGKEAITHYHLLERFTGYSHIRCRLETGRTHQIRVHLASIRHPLVGDPLYVGRQRWSPGTPMELGHIITTFPRQALHAQTLSLVHPTNGKVLSWQAPLPADMQRLLQTLSDYRDMK